MYTSLETGLDQKLIAWIYHEARKQHWRVAAWYDLEDLVQDAMEKVVKCRIQYPTLDNKHFSANVKKAFNHHIIDLSNKLTTGKYQSPKNFYKDSKNFDNNNVPIPETKLDDTTLANLIASVRADTTQLFAVLCNEASPIIKAIIALYDDPAKLILLRAPLVDGETRNKRLCALIHLKPEEDVCGMIRTYFGTA